MTDPRIHITRAQYENLIGALALYELHLEDEEPPHVAASKRAATERAWQAIYRHLHIGQ